jgi:hypothetical protein
MVTTGGEGQFYITDPTENCYAQRESYIHAAVLLPRSHAVPQCV